MRFIQTSVFAAPVVILLLFAGTLVGVDRLGFRDVSHFYTPLYDYVAWRTSNEWLPLWNPLDQTGIPLIGETSTAVCYPVRYVLFALPISTETAIAWYVALHLSLASATAWWAARWSPVGHVAATVASVVYPLSGSVLFLYTNPPFLVGAAWLPLVLGVMFARVGMSAVTRILIGGTSMSMMILGGDPQTALHAMIVVTLVWMVRLIRRKETGVPCLVLLAVPILAAMLAAPQLAASISWSSQSDRTDDTEIEHWVDPPPAGGRRYEAFQFSLAPWHVIELATPNAFGSLLPTNRRISRLIAGDGRMWTPSIYMGMLVMVALLCRIRTWRSHKIDPWLATAVASLVLAMGHFGVLWWIQAVTHALPDLDSAIGGPYWWLYQLVPGYDSFRYPAKWLTLFSLASAIVTAHVIDKGLCQKTICRVAFSLAVTLTVAFAILLLVRWDPSILFDPANGLANDEFWGPLNIKAGLSQIGRSIVHSIVALTAIGFVVRLGNTYRWSDETAKLCLLAIVLIDVGVFAQPLVARVPRKRERELITRIDRSTHPADSRWMRTQSGGGWPSVWKETPDHERILDVEASVRAAWFGRWHLADRVGVLNNMVSIRSREMAMFWKATRQITTEMSQQQRDEFWGSIRRWLLIDGVVHTTTRSISIPIDGRVAEMVDQKKVIGGAHRLIQIHSHWTYDESLERTTRRFAERLGEIAGADGMGPPVLQTTGDRFVPAENSNRQADVRVITGGAEQAEFEVHLAARSLLRRPIFQDGHWTAQYAPANSSQWRPAVVHRVDYLTQGVLLPAGDWKLRFRYSPWWLGWSLAVAAISWVLVSIVVVRLQITRRM